MDWFNSLRIEPKVFWNQDQNVKDDCKHILIVEDDISIRQMMKHILELEGYQVSLAGDGEEGIEALKQVNSPCVVILDMMMPKTNGWWFLDQQRNHPELKKIPVVICSAYEESAKSVKPAGFVPKPIHVDSLLGAVKTFCA